MIIAGIYVAVLLFGGGDLFTFDYLRDLAKEAIQDKDRAKQVIYLTKQADEGFESFAKKVEKRSKQLAKMNKDYNVTREEMESQSVKGLNNRKEFFDKYVEIRFQIKELVTAEEWKAMHPKKED